MRLHSLASTTEFRRPVYDAFLDSLLPLIALRFDEASGNPVNYGSATGLTIAATSITYSSTPVGRLGTYSYGYAAAASRVVITIDAQFSALQAFTLLCVVTMTSITNPNSRLMSYEGATGHTSLVNADGSLFVRVERATTDTTVTTAAGFVVGDGLPKLFAFCFDASQGEALRAYLISAGTLNKVTGITQGSGAALTMAVNLYFGNASSNNRALIGQYGRGCLIPAAASEDNVQIAARAAGF